MTFHETGTVASGHPLATDAGLEALKAGGSAVDAALAAAFTQWTVNSPLCGPGGELLMMVAHGHHVTVYGGWSRTPSRLPLLDPIPYDGPLAAVIPGAVPAAHAAWQDHGVLTWAELFADSIENARTGHPVTPWMATSYATVAGKHPDSLPAFLDQPGVPAAGDIVTSARFAETLTTLAEEGPSALHSRNGCLGRAVADASAQADGYVGIDDLARVEPLIQPAVSVQFEDGLHINFPGPPSQSSLLAEILEATGPDPSAVSEDFIVKAAPATQAALVRRCVVGLQGTATSIAAVGDCAAVAVHSLAGVQYGTGWIAGDTAIALGNRVGTAHSTRPDLAGAHLRPGEYPAHTLSAAFLQHRDRSVLIATPGGDRQVQWLAQAAQRFRHGHSIDEMVSWPRWFVCPEGDRFGVPGGIGSPWYLFAEPDLAWRDRDALAGFPVKRVASVGGGLQAVERESRAQWIGASDPRSGGKSAVLHTGTDHQVSHRTCRSNRAR